MIKILKKGFTLVELVIVIAVIAILSAVLLPTFAGILERARENTKIQRATSIRDEYIGEYLEVPQKMVGAVIEVEGSYYKVKEDLSIEKIENVIVNDDKLIIGNNSYITSNNNNVYIIMPEKVEGAYDLDGNLLYAWSNNELKLGNTGASFIIKNNIISANNLENFTQDFELTIPTGVTQIDSTSFVSTNLKKINLPEGITNLTRSTFSNCTGISYTISEYGRYLGNEENPYMYLVSLTNEMQQEYVINSNTKYVCESVFRNCMRIKKVSVPNSLEGVGRYAFQASGMLAKLEYNTYNNGYYLGNEQNPYVYLDHIDTTVESFNVNENTKVIGINGFAKNSTLKSVIIPKNVIGIGTQLFTNSTNVESIFIDEKNEIYHSEGNKSIIETKTNKLIAAVNDYIISENIKVIGDYAFSGCKNLTTLTISNNIEAIGDYAFSSCTNLTSVTIPDSVKILGNSVFSSCTSLTQINLSNSITDLGNSVFSGCTNLAQITIPDNIKTIGNNTFSSCTNLEVVNLPTNLESLGKSVFLNCTKLQSIEIPSKITILNEQLFKSSGLTQIIIPKNVKVINNYAFNGCVSLKKVTFEEGSQCEEIASYVFSGCTALNTFIMSNTVKTMGYQVFYNCTALTNFEISSNIETMGRECFNGWTSSQFNAYNNAYYVGNSSNSYVWLVQAKSTSITSCIIHAYTKGIGYAAFEDCTSLSTVTFNSNNNCVSIGELVFRGCTNLSSINVPQSIKFIGMQAFYECKKISSITLPINLESIEDYLFVDCIKLTSIVIPSKVKSIGYQSFDGCTALSNISFAENSECESFGQSAFADCTSLKTIFIPRNIKSIQTSSYNGCLNIETITVDENNSFYRSENNCIIENETNTLIRGCKTSIIPESVEIIADRSFFGTGITSVTIPKNVKSVGEYAFSSCDYLTIIKVDANNPYLDSRNNCNAIIETETNTLLIGCKNTIIPVGVEAIRDHAFYECDGLTSITIPQGVKTIGEYSFAYCYDLKTITIREGLEEIQHGAFYYSNALTTLKLPKSLTKIEDNSVSFCDSLSKIYYAGSSTDWSNITIQYANAKIDSATKYYNQSY